MYEVLVNRLGGLSLPRKSVVRLTDRPDMTLDVYRGRKTRTTTQHNVLFESISVISKRWVGDNESLCAVEPRLRMKRSPTKAGLEPGIGQRLIS